MTTDEPVGVQAPPAITLQPQNHLAPTKQPAHHPAPAHRGHFTEPWQAPLFGCYEDIGLCLQTTTCPCAAAGLVLEFTEEAECLPGCCISFLPGVSCVYLCLARSRVREMHHIRGSCGRDCLLSFLCPPCVLWQTTYELDIRPSQLLNRL